MTGSRRKRKFGALGKPRTKAKYSASVSHAGAQDEPEVPGRAGEALLRVRAGSSVD